jgi:uroporphyrinogen decarboxylase
MNARERFHSTMKYQPVDRAPFYEFMWPTWPETAERWAKEGGYAQGKTDFGCDKWLVEYSWFWPQPPFAREILAEDAEHVTFVDLQGIVMREFKNNPLSSMPQFISYPVVTREDFRKYWRERMQPDLTQRIGPDWRQRLGALRNRDFPFVIIADRWGGFFGPQRNLVGVESLCTLFYDDPAFVEEMLDADADFLIQMLSQILEVTDVDVFGFWEDMAYHTAPLLSPKLGRQFMLPRYRKVVDFGRAHGVHLFGLDSDGNIDPLIPVWMDSGIDILYPFEVQADMDVVALRKKYGRDLRMWGGVDKRPLAMGHDAIDRELERVKPLIDEGGYLPMLDHSATPDIPYENYRYFLERLRTFL